MTLKTKQRSYYHLFSLDVVYTMSTETPSDKPGGEPIKGRTDPMIMAVNTMVTTTDGKIALRQLARAQQAAQMQVLERMEDPTLTALNVVITGIMNLGMFTPEEFNQAPTGMEQQQVAPEPGQATN